MADLVSKYFSGRKGKPGYVTPVMLHDGSRTKRIAQLWHITHDHPKNDGLALDLIKYDKPPQSTWPDELAPSKEISLSEREVKELYDYLSANYGALGIRESGNYAIIPLGADFKELSDQEKSLISRLIKALLRQPESLERLSQELEQEPGVLAKLRNLTQFKKYGAAKTELERLVRTSKREQDFKDWFKLNPWIFGTEYISNEQVAQIALRHKIDLCFTSADGYQDVIELKTPDKELLREDTSHPGSYYPSEDLAKAIAQCSNYLYEIEEQRPNIERAYGLPFLKPRARIVMGRSIDWREERKGALRRLNAAFHNIDIMTFDHILLRANKMIEYFVDQPSQNGGAE